MTPLNICRESIELLSDPLHSNNLNDLARRYNLSVSDFENLFKRHVGVCAQQFQQRILATSQSDLISQNTLTNSESSHVLSAHNAFVTIDALSPNEFKSQGPALVLRYARHDSVFGPLLVVASEQGIFYLGFHQEAQTTLRSIQSRFPHATLMQGTDNELLTEDLFLNPSSVVLHVPATQFQIRVWHALLTIQPGQLVSYKDIAHQIGNPKGAQGVGQAVAANPVAFLIPCHRVIKQSGAISGYRWGVSTKQTLLAWEQAMHVS